MKKVGLRIDVDTFRGTRDGVPRLLELLDEAGLQASFFFSVGPDNMGRHLWRLVKPGISVENAALARGIPLRLGYFAGRHRLAGPRIGAGNEAVIRAAAQHHEVGLHAWDHHAWQAWAGVWDIATALRSRRSSAANAGRWRPFWRDGLSRCSAVAGWRADQRVVKAKEPFAFRYNSDCRGTGPFFPLLPQRWQPRHGANSGHPADVG